MCENENIAVAGPSTPKNFDFVIGDDNRQILVRAGRHHYLHHTLKNGSQMWACTLSKTCGARLKILGTQVLREDAHKCTPNNQIVATFKKEMQKKVTNSHITVTQAYREAVKKYVDSGYDLISDVPTFNNVKSSLYRLRNHVLGVSKTVFKNAKDVEVPALFKEFLLFDYNKEVRILAFSTVKARKIIEKQEVFFVDGTFRSTPSPFYQLYTLHVDLFSDETKTNVIPVLFALLPNKSQTTYEILFKSIKECIPNWRPKKIIIDFELAAINAIKNNLPEVVIRGCNFHYKQALIKKSEKLGISSQEDKKHIARCAALAHLPSTEIDEGWLAIMEISPDNEMISKFNDYFVNIWLDNASLPKDIWTCAVERHRTINLVEAWHKRLNNQLVKNPRFLEFLFVIWEEAQYFIKYHCAKNNRSRQSINKDLKLKIILRDYSNKKNDIKKTIEELSKL